MEDTTKGRVQARDAALRLLNRLTLGVAFSAVAGVGLLGVVSAQTIPGTKSTTTSTAIASTAVSNATSSSTASSSLGSSSTPVTASSSSGIAVSGGS